MWRGSTLESCGFSMMSKCDQNRSAAPHALILSLSKDN